MEECNRHWVFKNTQTIRQSSQKHISTKLCMTHLLNVFKTCMKSQVLPPPEPVPNRLPPELAPRFEEYDKRWLPSTVTTAMPCQRGRMRTLRTTAKYFARYFSFHLILIYFCRHLDQQQFAYLNWLQKLKNDQKSMQILYTYDTHKTVYRWLLGGNNNSGAASTCASTKEAATRATSCIIYESHVTTIAPSICSETKLGETTILPLIL